MCPNKEYQKISIKGIKNTFFEVGEINIDKAVERGKVSGNVEVLHGNIRRTLIGVIRHELNQCLKRK